MSRITRRQLLQAGAGAGVTALMADPLLNMALGKKLPAGKLTDIEHVVILVQENRSFDHYFGMLPGVRGYGDKSVPQSRFEQAGYEEPGFGGVLLPYHAPSSMGAGRLCFPDITHSWVPQHESWNNEAMDAFMIAHEAFDGAEAAPAVMAYYEREDIPFYWALAENFTICDNYHCSVFGPTYPNRLYSMSATLDPNGENGGPLVETLEDFAFLKGRFTWPTMPEQLQSAGVTWKSYTGIEAGFDDNVLEFFHNFQNNEELKRLGLEPTYPKDFLTDLKHDELPQVAWINTSITQTEHPGNSSAVIGEFNVQNIIKALQKHKIWEKTALFITWDENGGFFDHVAPPVAPPGTPFEYLTVEDISNNSGGIKGPIGLGFRVPLLVASPYTRGGFLCSDTFDHTSLLRFLETRFGVEVPNLSEWRRSVTGDLTSAFDFIEGSTNKGKLPKLEVPESEFDEGACEEIVPLKPPPNSMPQQPSRYWRTPSGV
jgi:phospholipase C